MGDSSHKFDEFYPGGEISLPPGSFEDAGQPRDDAGDALARARREIELLAEQLAIAQTARHAAESDRQRSAFLAEASLLLSSSLDLNATFNHIAQLATLVLADWCVVDVLDDRGLLERISIAHAEPAKLRLLDEITDRHPTESWAHPILTNVIRTARPVFVPKFSERLLAALECGGLAPQYLEVLRGLALKSMMVVPILAGERAIGAITFLTAESGRRYGPEDLALAEALARPAATALENARRFAEADRQRREALALEAVARDIASALDQDVVLRRIADSARELCGADLAFLATCDGPAAGPRLRAAAGAGGAATLAAVEAGVLASAEAPVRFRDAVIGLLRVAQRTPRQFSECDTAIVAKLADHAAIALETSRLYVQAEQLAVNRERVRVANELHDTLSQLLFSMALKLDWCVHQLDVDSRTRGKLNEIRREAGFMMTQIRRLISELSQEEDGARSLSEKLHALLEKFRELTGVETEFVQRADLEALDEPAQKLLRNIIQEALANVAKHANASRVWVALELRDGEVSFEVADNGRGAPPEIDPAALTLRPGHFGLRQMTERLEAAGGRLELSRLNPHGFRLAGIFPVKASRRDAQDSDRGC